MDDKERFAEAKKRAKMKYEFYVHLVIYLVVIGALFFINLFTSSGYFWFVWPAMGWGIAVLLHGVRALVLPNDEDLIDTLARRELDKQQSKHH